LKEKTICNKQIKDTNAHKHNICMLVRVN